MRNIVGQVARGNDFWDRKEEIEDIWRAIDNGSHILLVAPRRVGKTSIMHQLRDEPKDNYYPVYIDTESADSQNEFWQKLFYALNNDDGIKTIKAKFKNVIDHIANIKIVKISSDGVEFGDGSSLNYKEAFKRFIKDLDHDKKLIIMLDEFAQTVENIISYEDKKNASSLLKAHRELRQDVELSQKVTFIYAGSIGLESVVAKLDGMKYINDLNQIKVRPLSTHAAEEFVLALCKVQKLELSPTQIEYMLTKIEWLIPFYIQLIFQEVYKLFLKSQKIDNFVIDKAISNALENRNHFESWFSKLKSAFEKEDYLFSKEVLSLISENKIIDILEIKNIADKHTVSEDSSREIIRSLIYDGYINNNDSDKKYRFNSPILRMWWSNNVAN